MDLEFLSQADQVTLKYELARIALDAAKAQLEQAKQAYEELLAQADSRGIPKAKLKKLTEDRVLALIESGLVSASARAGEEKKGTEAKRPKKAKAEASAETRDEGADDGNFPPPEGPADGAEMGQA